MLLKEEKCLCIRRRRRCHNSRRRREGVTIVEKEVGKVSLYHESSVFVRRRRRREGVLKEVEEVKVSLY